MKKSIILIFVMGIIVGTPASAQFGKLLNKVSKSVANEFKTPDGQQAANQAASNEPEPKCACDKPMTVLDLGGKLKLMYSEISISMREDGALLIKDRISNEFYIVKEGNAEGPIKSGDPRLKGFGNSNEDKAGDETAKRWANNEYISRSGEKYLIKFNGKSYGPYADIRQFKVSRSKDKFAAEVVENIPLSAADGEKMDEAINNAKTEEEKQQLALQYTQEMARKMQEGGGPMSTLPKIVTNIPGVTYDPLKSMGGFLNNSAKYDDILITTNDKVIDLSNKVLINLKPEAQNSQNLFVSTSNTNYAYYKYGTLTLDNGKVFAELFNPHLVKSNGEVVIAYMYYSPKNNSIMQCTIPF